MNLYGSDMDESVSPLESNMAATVVWEPQDRQFIGRQAIENTQPERELIGLVMEARGVLRSHQKVYRGEVQVGEITSGAYSPTLGYAIALARIDLTSQTGESSLSVEIRNRKLPVQRVIPPFVRNGKKVYKTVKESEHG
jgi:aminomethyltransferase